ncbi:glycosyltransferase family 2 protein [Frigoribacterium faeni]|uniref:glycosyltransferase family 2 protein n=1 Tax=Frigoribacterium faeni TaxID=145483 RepID=UPI001FABDD93|nr:glycosyltransferase family 2 protein [Frigoribacterium faeni]MCJ0700459.1 glycosyltransferase family 2 protein [Frigoribacterium faeni]
MTSPFDTVGDRYGIVVVNYNSSSLIAENLVRSGFAPNSAVIVVDNSDDAAEKARLIDLSSEHDWTVIDAGGNIGFGAGVNMGVARAVSMECDAVLLLNPDAMIDGEHFTRLAATQARFPRTMISPVIDRDDGTVWFSGAVIDASRGVASHRLDRFEDSDWLSGACLSVPLAVWRELGGMDSDYFLYWEDVDFTSRWRLRGNDLLVASDVRATHSVGGTQAASRGKSLIFIYYNCRNRLLFASKNMPRKTTLLWGLTTPGYWLLMLRLARVRRSPEKFEIIRAVVAGTASGLRASTRPFMSRKKR